uniref:Uncharacterized protein n=1 Tax=Caenorhabditis japonica TaxID=281687 RepID=A0A8R1HYV1_CAEJA
MGIEPAPSRSLDSHVIHYTRLPNLPTARTPMIISEFRACCQVGQKSENCTTFANVRELIGVACCGSHVYNTSSQLCCDSNVHNRDRGEFSLSSL